MERVIVKLLAAEEYETDMEHWRETSTDGELLDLDVLGRQSTFVLGAIGARLKRMAFLPVQQPLMLESLIYRPDLTDGQRSQAIARMVEYAVGEAYRRDAGEVYFLTRDEGTMRFAEAHHFKSLERIDPRLKVFRLNLLETFGA